MQCGPLICTCSSTSSVGMVPFDKALYTFPMSDNFKTVSYGPDVMAVSKGRRIGVSMGIQMVAL